MERESGFYWVKYQGELEVAEFTSGSMWYLAGNEIAYTSNEMDEINETKLHPPA